MTINEPDNTYPKEEPITDAALSGNADMDSKWDASEYRDIPIETLSPTTSAQYANTTHGVGEVPTDSRRAAIAERRAYANQSELVAPELTQELGARRYSGFSVTAPAPQGNYPGAAVMLLGDDRSRVRTVIANAHISNVVLVGPYDQVSTGNGFTIPPDSTFETTTTEAVYVCVPNDEGAEAIRVGVWAEYA